MTADERRIDWMMTRIVRGAERAVSIEAAAQLTPLSRHSHIVSDSIAGALLSLA